MSTFTNRIASCRQLYIFTTAPKTNAFLARSTLPSSSVDHRNGSSYIKNGSSYIKGRGWHANQVGKFPVCEDQNESRKPKHKTSFLDLPIEIQTTIIATAIYADQVVKYRSGYPNSILPDYWKTLRQFAASKHFYRLAKEAYVMDREFDHKILAYCSSCGFTYDYVPCRMFIFSSDCCYAASNISIPDWDRIILPQARKLRLRLELRGHMGHSEEGFKRTIEATEEILVKRCTKLSKLTVWMGWPTGIEFALRLKAAVQDIVREQIMPTRNISLCFEVELSKPCEKKGFVGAGFVEL